MQQHTIIWTEKLPYLQPLKEAARQSEVVDGKAERQTEHFVTMQGDLVHTATPHRILYTHAHARNAQLEKPKHARTARA